MDTTDNRTLAQLAAEALQVQDACNLSGVVHGFSRAMHRLCELVPSGTRDRNTHPISVLWAYKCASLAGIEPMDSCKEFNKAHVVCQEIIMDVPDPEYYGPTMDELAEGKEVL